MAKSQNCPACGETIVPPRASMSRYVNLYICADCGQREALGEGFFWARKYAIEKPTQPVDFDPWK